MKRIKKLILVLSISVVILLAGGALWFFIKGEEPGGQAESSKVTNHEDGVDILTEDIVNDLVEKLLSQDESIYREAWASYLGDAEDAGLDVLPPMASAGATIEVESISPPDNDPFWHVQVVLSAPERDSWNECLSVGFADEKWSIYQNCEVEE